MSISLNGKKWRRKLNGKNGVLFREKHVFSQAEVLRGEFLEIVENDPPEYVPEDRSIVFY